MVGRAGPSGAIGGRIAARAGSARRGAPAPSVVTRGSGRSGATDSAVRAVCGWDHDFPAPLCATTRSLRRCCSFVAISGRSGAVGSVSSGPATPPGSGAKPPSSWATVSPPRGWRWSPGLAKGIDGAVHRGVHQGGGGAADRCGRQRSRRPVPRMHAESLGRGRQPAGVLLSEWPPGTAPEAFRFPLRNRIIAGLSELLVVVESRERGGSLITANAAIERGIDVLAVPGSPQVRAALGTNQLLRDGAGPVTEVADVLMALGSRPSSRRRAALRPTARASRRRGRRPGQLRRPADHAGHGGGRSGRLVDRCCDGGGAARANRLAAPGRRLVRGGRDVGRSGMTCGRRCPTMGVMPGGTRREDLPWPSWPSPCATTTRGGSTASGARSRRCRRTPWRRTARTFAASPSGPAAWASSRLRRSSGSICAATSRR